MFVGHYSVSLVAKKFDNKLSLGILFLAVQFLDILWSIFVLLGVERFRIVPGLPSSPLDLYYMPFTHSLLGAALWSILVYLMFRFLPIFKGKTKSPRALIISLAVFSHWVLDLLVHRPDLALYDNHIKVGFGLWNYPTLAFTVESLILIVGFVMYMKSTKGTPNFGSKYGMPVFVLLLLTANTFNYFFSVPPGVQELALFGLLSYLFLAAIAHWLDRKRGSATA